MINKLNINNVSKHIGAFAVGVVQDTDIDGVHITGFNCTVIQDVDMPALTGVVFQGKIHFHNQSSSSKDFWVQVKADHATPSGGGEGADIYYVETVSAQEEEVYPYYHVKLDPYDGYSGGGDESTWEVMPPEGERYQLLYSKI